MTKIRIKMNFIMFIIFLLLFILITNLIYIKFVLPKKQINIQYQSYKDYISNLTEKLINFAFFGDSHARNDVNPKFIKDSFNFGTSAENYFTTYYKLKKITEKDNVKIDYAIFEIDLQTFSSSMVDKNNLLNDLWLFKDIIPYQETAKLSNASTAQVFLLSHFPFIGKGTDFIAQFKVQNSTPIFRGWAKEDRSILTDKGHAKFVLNNNQFQMTTHERISPVVVDYFKKTLIYAKKNNITIIFIKYPVYKDYDDMVVRNNITKKEYYDYVFKIIKENIKDYYVLDYYDIYIDKPEYFSSADHLNSLGAEIFSKKLSDDLTNIRNKPK